MAFYGSRDGLGVVAPRGWHCFELYGSNGQTLIVTPERHDFDFFHNERQLDGPAVVLTQRYGGTSGRWAVAAMIVRYFPEHSDFVRGIEEMGLELGEMPAGPFPDDVVHRIGPNALEYTTPTNRDGLGTTAYLGVGAGPIAGLVMLFPETDMNMIHVAVRLPPELSSRTPVIVEQVRREWERRGGR